MYKFLIVTLLIILSFPIFGQNLMEVVDPQFQNSDLIYNDRYKEIKGSPYYFDEFVEGEVVLNTGGKLEVALNLDLVAPGVIAKLNNEEKLLDNKLINKVVTSNLDGKSIFKTLFIDSDFLILQQLYLGKSVTLYKNRVKKIVIKEAVETSYSDSNSTQSYFTETENYVLMDKGGAIKQFESGKKNVLEALGNDKMDLKSYTKKSGHNLRKESDIIELIKFYDSKK